MEQPEKVNTKNLPEAEDIRELEELKNLIDKK